MVVRLGWIFPLPKGLIPQPQACTWDDLLVPGMEVVRGEEEVVEEEAAAAGIEMGTEGGRTGDMEEAAEGEMIIVGGGLHLHIGGGEVEADQDHSPQGGRDTDQRMRPSKIKFERIHSY